MHAIVAGIMVHEIGQLALHVPKPSQEQLAAILAARAKLNSLPPGPGAAS